MLLLFFLSGVTLEASGFLLQHQRVPSSCSLALWVLKGMKMGICYTGVDREGTGWFCSGQQRGQLPGHRNLCQQWQWDPKSQKLKQQLPNSAGSSVLHRREQLPRWPVFWPWMLLRKAQSRLFFYFSQWYCNLFHMPLYIVFCLDWILVSVVEP